MNFSLGLLEDYDKVLELLFRGGLEIFYRERGDDNIRCNDEELGRIKKAVEVHKKTFKDFDRFVFTYRLWRGATSERNLPLPPCKQILPLALASWNINKPSGDMVTQMNWDLNYDLVVSTPQTILVKRLAHQLVMYQIHRLFQLFATDRELDSFNSIYHFRDVTRRNLTFWKSSRHLESILLSMSDEYNPPRALQLQQQPTIQQPSIQLPAGVVLMPGMFPVTGDSPQRYKKVFYENTDNSHLFAFQRRHSCLGNCVHRVAKNANGDPIDGCACSQCGRVGASWHCFQCHVYLHNSAPSKRVRKGDSIEVMAATTKKRDADRAEIHLYAQLTCADKWHYSAKQQAYVNLDTQSMPSMSIVQFDPDMHNTVSNLSFEDAMDTSNTEDGNTTGEEGSGSILHSITMHYHYCIISYTLCSAM